MLSVLPESSTGVRASSEWHALCNQELLPLTEVKARWTICEVSLPPAGQDVLVATEAKSGCMVCVASSEGTGSVGAS